MGVVLWQWEHQKAKPFRHSLHLGATARFTRYERRHIRTELPSQTWNQGTTMEAGDILSQWLGGRCHNRRSQSGMCLSRLTEKRGSQELELERTPWSGLLPSLFLGDCCEGWGLQAETGRICHCLAKMWYSVLRMTELWTIAWFSQQVVMGRIWKP